MSLFDTYIMVDWSAASVPSRAEAADSIWIGVADIGGSAEVFHYPTRMAAEVAICEWIQSRKGRVLIGFDFAFGYPKGFAQAVTGSGNTLGLWDWLGGRIRDDDENRNNRFVVANDINASFDEDGPFWGKAGKGTETLEHLSGKKHSSVSFLPQNREVELAASGNPKTVWQLHYNGAVGSQTLMGLPMLSRIRTRYQDVLRVWPFEEHEGAEVVLAEIYPSLLNDVVALADHRVKDARQVQVMAEAFARLDESDLDAMFKAGSHSTEEGWILGVGAEEILRGSGGKPRLANDCFALPAGVDWTPVDEALRALEAALGPVVEQEKYRVFNALDRVLARDVVALRANPPAANSAIDGYGFAFENMKATMPLVDGRAAAGARFGVVPKGYAIRILTGAVLPEGVDTVVMQEECDVLEGAEVRFKTTVKACQNTRNAGEDVSQGEVAFEAGRRLGAQDLALLTALGVAEVEVFKPLRLGVLSTGDELVDAGPDVPSDRTFDANRPMLLGLADAWGCATVDLGHVPDDRDALRGRLNDAKSRCDVVLTSGGASAGDEDHVSALLSSEGQLTHWRIAVKPGRPLALAIWDGMPVFGLPGNPVAAFVCSLVFARPALSLMGGGGWAEPQAFMVPAAFSKSKKRGRREYLRAQMNCAGAVEVFASEGSGRISGLSWAEGLVELEDGAREIEEGDLVRYLPFGSFGI